MSLIEEVKQAREAGFVAPKRKRKSAAELGTKHAAKVAATRAVKDVLGNGIIGQIASVLMRDQINKGLK